MIPYLQITPRKSIYGVNYVLLFLSLYKHTDKHIYILMPCLFSKDLGKLTQILEFFKLLSYGIYRKSNIVHSYLSMECEKIDNVGKWKIIANCRLPFNILVFITSFTSVNPHWCKDKNGTDQLKCYQLCFS